MLPLSLRTNRRVMSSSPSPAANGWQLPRLQRIAIGTGVGAVILACSPPLLLVAAGFGSAGPVAGGIAASVQTATTVAGGCFAIMQSAGMAGVAFSTTATVAAAGGATGALIASRL